MKRIKSQYYRDSHNDRYCKESEIRDMIVHDLTKTMIQDVGINKAYRFQIYDITFPFDEDLVNVVLDYEEDTTWQFAHKVRGEYA